MTRLTDAQIEREWNATDAFFLFTSRDVEGQRGILDFAHRIAALAVQDMTQYADALKDEVAGFEWGWEQREKAHDAALAEVTKERDYSRVEVINLRDTRDALTAALSAGGK
jgi:hypothetical protein